VTSVSWPAANWVTRVDGGTSTVAGPFDSVSVMVPPDTDATRPPTWSLPAAGVGLGEADELDHGDDPVVVGLLDVLDDADGVLEEPQAASESAVSPASATAPQRDMRVEVIMTSRSALGLSVRYDHDVRSLRARLT
jgi:hypothetical protein